KRGGAWMWYATGAVVVVGGAAALFFASPDEPTKPAHDPRAADATAAVHDAGAAHEAAPAASPLAAFAGHWRSTSGRDFMAVPVGDDALEFRIQQASQH